MVTPGSIAVGANLTATASITTLLSADGADVLNDAAGNDTLTGGAGFGLNSLSSVTFDIGAGATALANGHPNVVNNSTTGALYFDASGGDGHLVQLANLTGHPTVTSSAFTLV